MKNYSKCVFLILFFPNVLISQITSTVNELFLSKDQPVPKVLVKATREFRERLLSDPFRPAYHFAISEDNAYPGDPNGAFYYNGRYHLMYLYNREGRGFCWGHVSSKDLLHWRHHPDALAPGNGDEGVFSGGAFVDDDGSAILSYWMLWGNKGIGLAKSTDTNFDSWKKLENNPIIKSTEWGITDLKNPVGEEMHIGSADPSNIWKKNGKYYLLTGNLLVLRKYGSRGIGLPGNPDDGIPLPLDSVKYQGDHLYLFKSDNLKNWKYQHEFYTSDRKWTSKTEDNMCPSFLPLPASANGGKFSGKHLLLFISHNKGCQYYIGDYKKDEFIPTTHGRMTWNDNAYFAPEALIDNKGRQIMWSWIFDDRPDSVKLFSGWSGTYGLPRSLWVGADGTLRIQPIKELENLRQAVKEKKNFLIKADSEIELNGFGKELNELEITLDPSSSEKIGIKVACSENGKEYTSIYYNVKEKKLVIDATKSSLGYGRKIIEEAPLSLSTGERLKLRVFVDKSIIEVFANDKQAISRNIYPTLGGTGIKLFSKGANANVISIKAWELMPSNPY